MGGERGGAEYGLDVPGVVVGNAVGGAAALVGGSLGWVGLRPRHGAGAVVVGGWLGLSGLVAVAQAGLMVRSSRVGKLRERDRILDGVGLRGDERVLDVGAAEGCC